MASFTIDTINLSMPKHGTDELLTANVYSMPGVNNDLPMSIGQLVMAICLARATELESKIIDLMEEMDQTSSELERLSAIEQKLVDGLELSAEDIEFLEETLGMSFQRSNSDLRNLLHSWASQTHGYFYFQWPEAVQELYNNLANADYQPTASDLEFLKNTAGIDVNVLPEDLYKEIETQMDSKNSFSQEKMIELQSQTNKRDQAYDMVANILKSLNTVLMNTVANI